MGAEPQGQSAAYFLPTGACDPGRCSCLGARLGVQRGKALRADVLSGGDCETCVGVHRGEGFPEPGPKRYGELARQSGQQKGLEEATQSCCRGGDGSMWGRRPRGLRLGNVCPSVLSLNSTAPQNLHKREGDGATVAVLTGEGGRAGPPGPRRALSTGHTGLPAACPLSSASAAWTPGPGRGSPAAKGTRVAWPSSAPLLGGSLPQRSKATRTHACPLSGRTTRWPRRTSTQRAVWLPGVRPQTQHQREGGPPR